MTNQQQDSAKQPGYYNLQPSQPNTVQTPPVQVRILQYAPFWFGLPSVLVALYFILTTNGLLNIAGNLVLIWNGLMLLSVIMGWMNAVWSVGLVVVSVLTAACVAPMVLGGGKALTSAGLDGPGIMQMAIFIPIPQLIASIMTFFYK